MVIKVDNDNVTDQAESRVQQFPIHVYFPILDYTSGGTDRRPENRGGILVLSDGLTKHIIFPINTIREILICMLSILKMTMFLYVL